MLNSDLIKILLNDENKREGVLKHEFDCLDSFLAAELDSRSFKNVIGLIYETESGHKHTAAVSGFAAESSALPVYDKNEFFISPDDKYAIKIFAGKNELRCRMITNENVQPDSCLVYCRELNEHFVLDSGLCFSVPNISGISLKELNFQLVKNSAAIKIYKIAGLWHIVTEFSDSIVSLHEESDNLSVNLDVSINFSVALLVNCSLKKIIVPVGNGFNVNTKLLEDKNNIILF